MKNLYELAVIFFRIGCFMFGGGSAMLPLLQEELVTKRHWLSEEKIMDYYSLSQSTPGIIAVNVATFTGYDRAGLTGAVVATFALITAPFIIILSLANILALYMSNPYVAKAFEGIRIVVVPLIAEAVCRLWPSAVKSKWDVLSFAVALGLAVAGVSVIMIMGLFCLIGLARGWKRGWK
ncbi:MAG: chromate transporter [Alphaproteobacteria bacterium]|nr:chromate transporter [Alphaproteobacteria bacterium]